MEKNPLLSKEEFERNKNQIKLMIKQLRGKESCGDIEKLQKEFEALLAQVSPLEIAMAEQELLKEGYTFEDLKSACDVHLALFKGTIENTKINVPEDHPIAKFQVDHRNILHLMEHLRLAIKDAKAKGSLDAAKEDLLRVEKIAKKLLDAENHNVRQENTLFPILEKHGVTAPPAIMWSEHTDMKEMKKSLLREFEKSGDNSFEVYLDRMDTIARVLMESFFAHSQKENNILYQTALDVITEEEWKDIDEECNNLGYFSAEI